MFDVNAASAFRDAKPKKPNERHRSRKLLTKPTIFSRTSGYRKKQPTRRKVLSGWQIIWSGERDKYRAENTKKIDAGLIMVISQMRISHCSNFMIAILI